LGSSSVLVNSSNGVVSGSTARYYPFGAYRTTPTQTITDRQFTGHQHNDDLGLIYMNARFYVPGIGRFASADIIVPDSMNPQAWNRYTYVANNPLILIDPSGHCWGFASGMRNGYFGTTCNNIDTAWSIVTNPDTTVAERLPAAAYLGVGTVAVGTVVAGTTVASTACLMGVGSAACAYAGSAIASANATAAAHPVATAVVGGLAETAIECSMTGGGCGVPDYALGAATAGAAHRMSQGRIYRSASGTADSLTPRPGIDDLPGGGLSFFNSLENPGVQPGKYVSVDVSRLNTLGAFFDNNPPGHVTVRPQTLGQLREWASTRGTGQIHPLTQELLDANLQIGKKPR
jgi:RHS repeat-associated protein